MRWARFVSILFIGIVSLVPIWMGIDSLSQEHTAGYCARFRESTQTTNDFRAQALPTIEKFRFISNPQRPASYGHKRFEVVDEWAYLDADRPEADHTPEEAFWALGYQPKEDILNRIRIAEFWMRREAPTAWYNLVTSVTADTDVVGYNPNKYPLPGGIYDPVNSEVQGYPQTRNLLEKPNYRKWFPDAENNTYPVPEDSTVDTGRFAAGRLDATGQPRRCITKDGMNHSTRELQGWYASDTPQKGTLRIDGRSGAVSLGQQGGYRVMLPPQEFRWQQTSYPIIEQGAGIFVRPILFIAGMTVVITFLSLALLAYRTGED